MVAVTFKSRPGFKETLVVLNDNAQPDGAEPDSEMVPLKAELAARVTVGLTVEPGTAWTGGGFGLVVRGGSKSPKTGSNRLLFVLMSLQSPADRVVEPRTS